MEYGITFIDGGFRPAIAKSGRKWTKVVITDGSRVRVIKTKDPVRFKPLSGYTLRSLAKKMGRKTNTLGLKVCVSKGAREILREAAHV